ncbi:MAG: site-2 protease family protein [Phycisphaerae bacterium]|nr:site-2 protease family protein [Phycisphaerae bacterium]
MNLDPIDLLIRVPLVLLALTVHEFCHAYFAYRMGDPTAARMGRLTLNPIRHLDPLGAICLVFAPIGWAKPVPVNPANFRNPRTGDLVTSAAGPGSNLVMALAFALLLRAVIHAGGGVPSFMENSASRPLDAVFLFCFVGVLINASLAVFNCLPIYPLDGFHITLQLLPPRSQQGFADTATYGPFMLLGFIVLDRAVVLDQETGQGVLGRLIEPLVNVLLKYGAGMH